MALLSLLLGPTLSGVEPISDSSSWFVAYVLVVVRVWSIHSGFGSRTGTIRTRYRCSWLVSAG